MDYDDFRHIETDYALVGRRSGRRFRMGDKVTIKVVAANLTKRQLDYEWVITAAAGGMAEAPVEEALHAAPAPGKGARKKSSPGRKANSRKPPKKTARKKKK
jgi:ribonuclease R